MKVNCWHNFWIDFQDCIPLILLGIMFALIVFLGYVVERGVILEGEYCLSQGMTRLGAGTCLNDDGRVYRINREFVSLAIAGVTD